LCGDVPIKLMMGGNVRDWDVVQLTEEEEEEEEKEEDEEEGEEE
jgi:hypothetical protein